MSGIEAKQLEVIVGGLGAGILWIFAPAATEDLPLPFVRLVLRLTPPFFWRVIMTLTVDQVRRIAKLSRVRLEEKEAQEFAAELSGILQWVEMLAEVNTDNVPQMNSVVGSSLPLREDVVNDGQQPEAVLGNAPGGAKYGYYVVPKVVE